MLKKLILLISTIFFLSAMQIFAGAYSGGSGTSGDPYKIATTDDLIELSNTSGDWDDYFIQTSNITFNSDETQVDWDGDGTLEWPGDDEAGFLPIGNNTNLFEGNYDGDGYTISNLYIDRSSTSYVGLFGRTNRSTIENIGIENCDITGQSNVGGLVGQNFLFSTVSKSYSTGSVSGISSVGGLIGYNNFESIIENSYSSCSVSGSGSNAGCLLGYNRKSEVKYSFSTGNVSGATNTGGFVGNNSSEISNCYSTGSVTRSSGSSKYFGGFCGYSNSSTIEYCYSTGKVYSSPGTIWNVDGNKEKGFVGSQGGTNNYTDNFFDTESSEQDDPNPSGFTSATAKNTSEMKDFNTFTGAGWDFDNNWIIGDNLNNGYPALWDGFQDSYEPTDQDSPSDGIINISNIAELRWMSENSSSWADDFEQVNDIDAAVTEYWNSTEGFSPIGNNSTKFTGTYDGKGYTISNLYIDRSSTNLIGLFGSTDGADISEIGIENCDITGYWYIGGLVGENKNSTISNSYSTGSVSAETNVGGLIGYNYESTIRNCYSIVDVTRSSGSDDNVGGFCGYNNNSTIEYCYSIGDVNVGGSTDKGFVGDGSSANCTDNFFDSEASNQNSDAIGAATPKTTSEMKDIATFTLESTSGLDNAWDFIDNPNDDAANENYWGINPDENDGYPFLYWQGYEHVSAPTVVTNDATDIEATTATGNLEITYTGSEDITQFGICINETGEPDINDTRTNEGSASSEGVYESDITSLSPVTTYYIRAYTINSVGTSYGEEKTFETTAAIPNSPTLSNPTLSSIDISVNPNNNPSSVEYLIEETTTSQYLQTDGSLGTSEIWQYESDWNVTTVTGLTKSTEYTFRIKARNDATPSEETVYSASSSEWTRSELPRLTTNNIFVIGNSKARSGGDIKDGGASEITAKGVCWNTTGSPTTSDNTTNDGSGDADYESIMGDLDVNQTYYVRAYANNSYGTSYGDEKTFIYTAIPTLPEWGLIILGSLIAVFAVRKILS